MLGQGTTHMTSLYLRYLLKHAISKGSQILKFHTLTSTYQFGGEHISAQIIRQWAAL